VTLLPRLPFYARYTFHFHVRAYALDGVAWGALAMNEIVLSKGFAGSDSQVALLAQSWPVSLLVAVWFGRAMVGRPKRNMFLAAGILGRLTLVLMPLVGGSPWAFIALLAWAAMWNGGLIPAQTSLFQSNYATAIRGKAFASADAVRSLVVIVTSLLTDMLLDRWAWSWQVIYPLAGVCGLGSCLLMARIKPRRRAGGGASEPEEEGRGGEGVWRWLVEPLVDLVRTLRQNRSFARFEANFMLYGMAFLMLTAVVPVYLVRDLGATYTEAAVARGTLFHLVMALSLPVMGRVHDALHPARFAALSFGLLIFYPVILAVAPSLRFAWPAFGAFGLAMAGVGLVWTLGAVHYAGERDAARYSGVHATLTGLRALVGAWLGYGIMTVAGARVAFVVAACLLALAALLMWRLARSESAATRAAASSRSGPDSDRLPVTGTIRG
jgi:MFS family permease